MAPVPAEDYLQAADLLLGGNRPAARQAFMALSERARLEGPAWVEAGARGELATLHYLDQNVPAALDEFEQAVAKGYCDCVGIHRAPELRPLFQDPRFQDIYGRIRLSQADFQELVWLHREIQLLGSETQQLIIQNMNRPDRDSTPLVQAPLPQREPQAPGVYPVRALMVLIQNIQRLMVGNSDQSRVLHLMQRDAIRAMPGAPATGGDYQELLRSRQQVQQQAQQRQVALHQRLQELARLDSLSRELQPPPKLGSLG